MTEVQYLQEQSRRAKASATVAVKEIKKDAARVTDPRPLLRKHPWISLGAALAVGFAATLLIGRALKHKSEKPAPRGPAEPEPERNRRQDVKKWIGRVKLVVSLLKPLIEGFMAVQAAASEMKQESPDPARAGAK
jgi:hypothetical protein